MLLLQVNDFFKSDSAAIENYEEEMSQNLNLDDVVITKKKSSPAPLNPAISEKKKVKSRQIVISDDEFETKSTFKQSKLNFEAKPVKPKVSLFSCLPSRKEETSTWQTKEPANLDDEKPGTIQAQDSVAPLPALSEDEILPDVCAPLPEDDILPDVCDVQHDVSLESLISPTKKQSPEETTTVQEETITSHLSRPHVEDLKDLNENELSDSLFEAINETWDFELSQKAPELVQIPVAPSQVPCLENSDFSLFSSQQNDNLSHPHDPVGISDVPLCPKSSTVLDKSLDQSDLKETGNTLTLDDLSKLNDKQETLFQSLAKMEKQQSNTDDLDFSDDITFSDIPSQTSDNIVQTSHISTPAQNKPFKPIESSTPAVSKLSVPIARQGESKEFVTPHVRPCLKRVKKKQNKIEQTPLPQIETTSCNSSAEDSPLNVGKRKRRCNILCSQVPSTSTHEDQESLNISKKSRLQSPENAAESMRAKALSAKRNVMKTKTGAAACPFVLSEADLSGEEDFEDGADEDFMSSSLEDFIDEEENAAGKFEFFLQN